MTIKDTVEERILDLQERKRELANATIEGKTAASKLTMNDMLALFNRDAEHKFDDGGHDIGFSSGRSKLLDSKNEDNLGGSFTSYGSSGTKEMSRISSNAPKSQRATPPVMEKNAARRRTPESEIYGRRW